MKQLMNYRALVMTIAVLAGAVEFARADETAVSFDDSTINVGTGGLNMYGWQFSTVSEIQISSLGVYDFYRGDGLLSQHPIAIWDVLDPAHPLVSAVIPAGVAPEVNDFRFVNVSPVMLPADHDFVIAALYDLNDDGVGALNAPNWLLTTGPGLEFGGYRFGQYPTTDLTFPQFYIPGEEEVFGPNFTYSVVPEPSTWSLMGLGGAALIFSKRARRGRCAGVKPPVHSGLSASGGDSILRG